MEEFDRLDLRILNLLQEDASLSNAEIAEQVGLSANACWRRVRRLEERGIVRKRVALLSQEKLALDVTVFVGIRTNEHNDRWLKKFSDGGDEEDHLSFAAHKDMAGLDYALSE